MEITHDAEHWREIAEALASGAVAFSTGHQCRTAPALAALVTEAVAGEDGDVTLGLDWDAALSVVQAEHALRRAA